MKQRTWNPAQLDAPLRWRKPYMVTLDVDPFDGMSDEQIAAVFGVMAACPSSIFRVWTAHPKQALEWFEWIADRLNSPFDHCVHAANETIAPCRPKRHAEESICRFGGPWPLSNVWLGIIAHTQAELDERAPDILACPAAMHWLRLVLHERVDLVALLRCARCGYAEADRVLHGDHYLCKGTIPDWGHIDVSGAIGKDAPPCDVEWIRKVIWQGRDAGVPVYVRALGSWPRHSPMAWDAQCRPDGIRACNGDRPGEWPEDLQVREWPEGVDVDG